MPLRLCFLISLSLQFNALASLTQNMHMSLQHQQHVINDMRAHTCSESVLRDEFVLSKPHAMAGSIQRLENHLVGEAKPDAILSFHRSKVIMRFSISRESLTKDASVAEVTVRFFVDDCAAGFDSDKRSDSWKDLDKQEKKSVRDHFQSIKRAVRMVPMHADSFPDPSTQLKERLRLMATSAEERTHNDLGFGNRRITVHTLTQHPDIKTLENTLKLPDNAPEEMRKFFTDEDN